jgi:hypothetical protein
MIGEIRYVKILSKVLLDTTRIGNVDSGHRVIDAPLDRSLASW